MIRIYLDQNKWIDLARAATGHALGARFGEALSSARDAVASGAASFPLDAYRYWETGKRANGRSRDDVVDVMLELSQQQTLALPKTLLAAELELALHRRYGRPESPRQVEAFGFGVRHISDGGVTWSGLDRTGTPSDGASPAFGEHVALESGYNRLIDEQILRAAHDAFHLAGTPIANQDFGEQYVDHENRIAREISSHGLSGPLLDLAVGASDLADIRNPLTQALGRIGLTWQEFVADAQPDCLMSFLGDLPTRYVTNVMRSAKLRQTQQKWEPNDLGDILALPVAAVYCDVVVTEKQWVHRLRQAKVEQRYSTLLLADAADLIGVLAAGTGG